MADSVGEAFLRDFALPLVRGGGEVRVGAPLGERGLMRLREEVAAGLDESEPGQALAAARQAVAAELLLHTRPPLLREDDPALCLLLSWHDLLFLQHPAAARMVAQGLRGRRLRRLVDFATGLCAPALPGPGRLPSEDPWPLLSRHSLLHGLWTLCREDVRVSFWAGRREFQGQEPPARLTAWRGVRRVHEERWRVLIYLQMLGLPDGIGRRVLTALLRCSPLTDLAQPRRLGPPLDLLAHAPVLRAPDLARAVAASYLEAGFAQVGGALGAALLAALRTQEEVVDAAAYRADLRTVLRFLSYLHLCQLAGPTPPELPGAGPSSGSGPGAARVSGGREGALLDFYAIYGLLCAHYPTLAWPADLAREGALAATQAYGERCRKLVGPGRLDELLGLCTRALGFGL